MSLFRSPFFIVVFAWGVAGAPFLRAQDANPIDAASLLLELQKIKDKQTVSARQGRQAAMQTALAGAANGERAAALWQEAVRAVQFEGEENEGARVREWKERDGDALGSKEARNAARLYFTWLVLTMQRDSGATVKDLFAQIVNFTKEVRAQQTAVDGLEEEVKRDRELNASRKHGTARQGNEDAVRRVSEGILNKGLAGSVVVQWLKIGDFVNPEHWEGTPNNANGIFNNIVLPELRAQKDPRLLEFWDMRLRQEGEAASKSKRTFDLEKYNTQVRPGLLWKRAEDIVLLGQKNRGITEMFNVVKSFPTHAEAAQWVARIEELLKPAPAVAAPVASPPAVPVAK